jgi:hypothetical protein
MNSKLILSSTAILLGALGVCLTFAPDGVISLFGITDTPIIRIMFQLLGAVYYAFALLNWMAKGALIGGIYNRPIAMANLAHFLIAGLALTKAVISNQQLPTILSFVAGFYMVTAGVFAVVISRHPITASA